MKSEERKAETFAADGVLVVDKPEGLTSHDVVARVRRILRTRRVGHTGTLDPFATGVLVVCVNRATRLAQFLAGDDKEYAATVRFGYATDTGDLTGAPLTAVEPAGHLSVESLRETLTHFRGRIAQVPPMYSAKKVGGVRLYELARRGSVAPPVLLRENADGTRECDVCVRCSSGTYVRTLAEDIGRRLGVGAHLTRLRRTRAGRCSIASAVTLEELAERVAAGEVSRVLTPMSAALDLPEVAVGAAERKLLAQGRPLAARRRFGDGEQVKLTDGDALLAIARYHSETRSLRPHVVLAPNSQPPAT